ncbi:MAG: methionine--tRNA ligase [Epulopiscium sp.]|nr:methionine--tRNA ligase [Candidatus Epulonipiscium sp.]
MSKKTYYITTPIYYPSDKLHIGHSYTTVAADTMARYKRLRGFDVKFLTGTDEHGQKIERIAKQKGMPPKKYVDSIVTWIKELWKIMDISYDNFIRTTDDYHKKTVQKIFKKLYEKGDIYKSSYEGWYCTPCEAFYTERQLHEGKCPDCDREVEKVKEESYFFKLSKYQDRLIEYIEKNPEFIQPNTRQNEMINNFLKPGLEDLCVSRTSFKWGIPIEFDPGHVVYVWVDALSNYITALGYLSERDEEYKRYWPADVHLVGKEIVRFHTIIWPALLMALGEPLPKQVFGHGWLVIDGGKMSKSKGNVVDPKVLVDHYGSDAIRYFLLREVAFGQDGNFSNEALIQRINADLANDFGNLISRTIAMVDKYFSGTLIEDKKPSPFDSDIKAMALETVSKVEEHMEKLLFSDALIEIWSLVRRANKYIDKTTPWILAKDEARRDELSNVLYNLGEVIRIASILVHPFMPATPKKIWEQLGIIEGQMTTWDSTKTWGMLPQNFTVRKGEILFPRIDIKLELEKLEEAQRKTREEFVAKTKSNGKNAEYISIDDFAKMDLRIGEVLSCEKVEKADKLLKSQIKIGKETRQIVSGIAKHYTPEEMVGKKVIVVCNLPPVKLRGILSEGMILAASDEDGNLVLASTDKDIESGAKVK